MIEEAKCKNCKGRGIVSGGAVEESKNYREGRCYYCQGTGNKVTHNYINEYNL